MFLVDDIRSSSKFVILFGALIIVVDVIVSFLDSALNFLIPCHQGYGCIAIVY